MKQNINTEEYWNKRFESQNGKTDWELCNGCNQSRNFMKAMIDNLPIEIQNKLKTSKILDVGCALGDGTNYVFEKFNNEKITGYDFSENAINIADKKYPDIQFLDKLDKEEKYDFVLINNVLQCVDNVEDFIKEITKITRKGIIIMVPFGTYGMTIEHYNEFQFISFPKDIDNFYRRKILTISTENWAYKQILVRYERIE